MILLDEELWKFAILKDGKIIGLKDGASKKSPGSL